MGWIDDKEVQFLPLKTRIHVNYHSFFMVHRHEPVLLNIYSKFLCLYYLFVTNGQMDRLPRLDLPDQALLNYAQIHDKINLGGDGPFEILQLL
jgi:hypothetical protein